VAAAARLGAVGYILKSVSPDDLPVLVRAVLSGSVPFLGSEASTAADRADDAHGLSSRELQILQGVAGGLTNKTIGRELWLSERLKFSRLGSSIAAAAWRPSASYSSRLRANRQ
jgi:DNA-binding NarL/FixJ family response regulator